MFNKFESFCYVAVIVLGCIICVGVVKSLGRTIANQEEQILQKLDAPAPKETKTESNLFLKTSAEYRLALGEQHIWIQWHTNSADRVTVKITWDDGKDQILGCYPSQDGESISFRIQDGMVAVVVTAQTKDGSNLLASVQPIKVQ